MNTKIVFALLIMLAVGGFVSGQEPNEGDIQVWNETKVYFKPITKTRADGKKEELFSPHFIGALRIGQDVRHFVNERAGFGVDIRINKYVSVTPSYLYVAEQKTRNSKAFEHRVRFDVTAGNKWKNFSLSNRNRVERRIKNSGADSTRYRNKTKLAFPVRNGDGKELFTPFVADEPYYDFSKKEWSRNEFSAGIGKKLSSKVSSEFFYMFQTNTGSTLKRVNIFGVNLKIKLY